MIDVKCKACGKRYDYHECGCCPNCGAYNRPPRRERITAEGDVYHISDAEYQKEEVRRHTQKGKVCFEEKVCYEEQAHSSSEYQEPSAFRDDYVASEDREEDLWTREEDTDERFEDAADAMEEDFEEADSRWDYMDEPTSKKKRVRPHGFQAEEASRKLNNAFNEITSKLNLSASKHSTKSHSAGIVVVAIIALFIFISAVGTVMDSISDAMDDSWSGNSSSMIVDLPEEALEIYDELEELDVDKSLEGGSRVYQALMQQPFVWWYAPVSVESFTVESGEDIYGYGLLVTVQMKGDYGFDGAPILYVRSGDNYWEPNFYLERNEKDEFGNEYVFLVDMPEEDVEMRLVCDGAGPDGEYEEVQIPLQ